MTFLRDLTIAVASTAVVLIVAAIADVWRCERRMRAVAPEWAEGVRRVFHAAD